MLLLLGGVVVLVVGGAGAVLVRRSRRWSTVLGVGSAIAGCSAGLIPAGRVLLGGAPPALRLPWNVPYGAFSIEIDALSAFFLVPVFALSALAASYAAGYLTERRPAASWFFFNLLVASMAVVIVARNAVLFLVAWEIMALASFFLVTHDDHDETVRDAGWSYLVATHLGTAWLLALFVLLGRGTGSLDFERFGSAAGAGMLFILAIVGFGTKAGLVPFHVWLPEAHPAAPSHVSALMSGVMVKTGIYGILRTLAFVGPLPAWAGWLLLGIGATSGVLGALFALAQHDLKRLLAYSTVENVGIIALALGLGLVGLNAGAPALAVLGFGGALLHVLNHAVFKGVLFLAAGAVLRGTKTGEIDALGGLLRPMPWTGATFLVGAIAVCGLPPLNGFVSEFLVYVGALGAATSPDTGVALAALVAIAALALIGGLAVAGFTRAFGAIFLGVPRTDHALRAEDPGPTMRIPLQLLAAACLVLGACAPALTALLLPVLVQITGLPTATVQAVLTDVSRSLVRLTVSASGLFAVGVVLAGLRRWLLAGRPVRTAVTWDCGYARSSPRMQYTASSFAQPLTTLFRPLIGTHVRSAVPDGYFPRWSSFSSETPDLYRERVYRPVFARIDRILSAFRWLQHGRVQLYVLYIAFTLVVLVVWKLGGT